MKFAAAVLAASGLLHAVAARADLAAAVDRVRADDCGGTGAALREDGRMDLAARRVAAGERLDLALRAAGVIASRSTLLHLTGVDSDAQAARALARDGCAGLDGGFGSIGAVRRGDQAWIVLASAISLPRPARQGGIDRRIGWLINQARARGGRCGRRRFAPAPPLAQSTALARAALAHSRDMAAHRRFRHEGAHGSTPALRVRRAGYGRYRRVGENIAAGAMTPAEVVRGWLASPAHCENIMDPRFTDTGVAYALDPGGPYGIYWTLDFATPAGR